MLTLAPANILFLREVSKKKLYKLTELAYKNPSPLYDAIKYGYFNIIRKQALDILRLEKQKAILDETRQYFDNAINIIESQNCYPAKV